MYSNRKYSDNSPEKNFFFHSICHHFLGQWNHWSVIFSEAAPLYTVAFIV